MAETLLADPKERLVSLDVFRGITIASMVLVNNPGSWGHMYAPLGHAQWDGWTPTDFVFPFFLFIVGVAMTFSFDRRIRGGENRLELFMHVVRRSILLVVLAFMLGAFRGDKWWNMTSYIGVIGGLWLLYAYPPLFRFGVTQKERLYKIAGGIVLFIAAVIFLFSLEEFGRQRIPGVLQRIAACYFLASIIMFFTTWKGRLGWTLFILVGYWIVVRYLDAPESYVIGETTGGRPDAPADALISGTLHAWIDTLVFGENLYSRRPDPEGLLSTLPATATVLTGTLVGTWMKTGFDKLDKATYMFCGGWALVLAGLCMDTFFPLNKKIWSSSYVVFCTGWAMAILAICYYLLDIRKWKGWSFPFVILGTNAILVFWLSTLMVLAMGKISISADDRTLSLKPYLYHKFYTAYIDDPKLASLAWAVSYVILWVILTYPLYRKKIFLKL